MRSLKTLLVLLLALTAICFSPVRAQDDEPLEVNEDTPEDVEEVPFVLSSPDVSTVTVFPRGQKFVAGQQIVALLGFNNIGTGVFNVTAIRGSLRYPPDWKYIIQNYTTILYDEVVQAGEQNAFAYAFTPDPFLEPRTFGLQIDVYYTDETGANFTNAFYNSTIQLAEAEDDFDAQTLFTYVGLVGVAGLILFVVYKSVRPAPKTRTPRAPVETGTRQVIQSEWLEGTNATRSPGGKSPVRARKVAK
eukprot:TRINITY_DN3943_c0_g1_i1.p1 TRINITY_DN3943_c0_g1~~TRINITY_DN3943_c0_g1_i1.p1  ORF type:complete len:247 (-),score=63.04 TRINITY_DN3943_c0_g1_i1:47-787(-)